MGCPPPLYIKEGGGRPAGPCGRAKRRSPPPSRSRTPPFLLLLGGGRKGERGKERGGRRPPPSPIRTRGRGGTRPSLAAPLSSHQGPCGPLTLRGGSGNPPALWFSTKSPGTLPVSEYSRPIYQSLCLDHFETPCHVRDHIRDSEQTSVHQNL